MKFFGMDLALSAAQALKIGLVTVLPYLALLAIMLVTGIYQNRQLQSRNTSGNVNPQQQVLIKIMPFFLPVFSFGFPAGLALYWSTQNFCRIGTNAYITRSVYRKEHSDRPIEATATVKPSKKATDGAGAARKAIGSANGNGKKTEPTKGPGRTPGRSGSRAGSGRTDETAPNGRGSDNTDPEPGMSTKSQRARQNAAGETTSRRSVNPRRSGERRSTPTEKE